MCQVGTANLYAVFRHSRLITDMFLVTDSCASYLISEVIEKQIYSPGYPGNIPRNISCEYYIRSRDQTGVIYIRFSELFLAPGDRLSFHNPLDDIIIPWEWHNGTRNSEVYVKTNSSSVRVLLSTANTEPLVRRRFKFFHKVLFSGMPLHYVFQIFEYMLHLLKGQQQQQPQKLQPWQQQQQKQPQPTQKQHQQLQQIPPSVPFQKKLKVLFCS